MMGAAKNEKAAVRLIAVDNIKMDRAIQSRAAMSMEDMREFSEAMARGDVFPPIVVFWDGKRYWLADGFHRHGAAKRAGVVDIRCEVHYGTRRDAIVYSAGANKKFSIKRTEADKRKAVEMLLADEEWFGKSASQIAAHVGVSTNSARLWRSEFCKVKGISLPSEVLTVNGKRRATSGPHIRGLGKAWRDGHYRKRLRGELYDLGIDESEAQHKLDALLKSEHVGQRAISAQKIQLLLASGGIASVLHGKTTHDGLGTYLACDFAVIVPREIANASDLALCCWTAIATRDDGRAIVVCYDPPQCEALDIAKQLGVEFMAPEELVESLKGS